jgi:LmbE family N-acetylglucosaminyl deacetylase
MKKILVIAAHPDDEVLGCGGTIAKLVKEGNEVHVVLAAEGLTSRQVNRNQTELKKEFDELYKKAKDANDHLGVTSLEFLGFPDNRMDSVDLLDIIKKIEIKLEKFFADVIYTHFPSDLNVDHRLLSEAVLTATRPMPGQGVKKIFFFEVPSSTDWKFGGSGQSFFSPNVFVNIESTLSQKMRALAHYQSEMRAFPHARSLENLENLAKVRGAHVGYKAAEAFILARELVD